MSRGKRGNNHLPKMFVRRPMRQLDQFNPNWLKISGYANKGENEAL